MASYLNQSGSLEQRSLGLGKGRGMVEGVGRESPPVLAPQSYAWQNVYSTQPSLSGCLGNGSLNQTFTLQEKSQLSGLILQSAQ